MEGATPVVRLNVGGQRFEVARSTVALHPQGLLERLVANAGDEELFVDRDPTLFRVVLNWYRNGQVDVPPRVSWTAVRRELDFFCLDVDFDTQVEVQNVGELWRERTMGRWTQRVTAFFATMFQTSWFREQMDASLELVIAMAPSRHAAEDSPATLFATKTARRLAMQVLRERFELSGRWETVESATDSVRVEYPSAYVYYRQAGEKLYQLVLCCNVDPVDATPHNKRSKRSSVDGGGVLVK